MKKNEEKKFIRVREASLLTGLDCQTIRKMVDEGKIQSYKTPTGQRRLNKESVERFCNTNLCINERKEETIIKKNFIYARVSSKKQLDDLSRQIEFIKSKEKYSSYDVITDICSGLDFKRKGLSQILDTCLQGNIGEIVIAYKDRLVRFGYELLEQLVTKTGGTITIVGETQEKSYEEEFTEDLLSIVHIFSCEQMGKRKYEKRNNQIEDSEN